VQKARNSVATVLSHSSYSASLNSIVAKSIVISIMSAEKSAMQCAIFLYVMVKCSELIRYFTTLHGNALFYLKRCP
jgi:hypothetical protein